MPNVQNRRRKLLFDKKVQVRFLVLPIFATVLNTVFFAAIIWYAVHALPEESSQILSPYYVIIASCIVVFIINLIIIGYLSLISSNRFIGPLYRLRKSIDELVKGSYGGKLAFRNSDFQYRLAQVYNDLAQALRERVSEDIEFGNSLSEKLKTLSESDSKDQPKQLSVISAEIDQFQKRKTRYLDIE
jgi:hypothetical protein